MATGETISFDAQGTATIGYLARPETGSGAAVIVVHEWWGLNEHVKDIARRFAAEGFVALAPDLYGGVVTKDPQEASQLMHDLSPDQGIQILNAAVEYLSGLDGVDANRIGVTGFCMGGSFSLLLACRNTAIRASAPFYGDNPSEEDLASLSAPILSTGAGKDRWITPEKMGSLRDALARHGKRGEVKIYEEADHAFFNDTRPDVYDAQAARAAWQDVLSFFRQELG